jgi:hypothetical protein
VLRYDEAKRSWKDRQASITSFLAKPASGKAFQAKID